MPYRVELSPEAQAQAEAAMSWWQANRPQAADLFLDELGATIQRLATMPRSGKPYARSDIPGTYRLLMPRTRYHVYYRIDEEHTTVRIHAVWHTSRRAAPDPR